MKIPSIGPLPPNVKYGGDKWVILWAGITLGLALFFLLG
jgi:hypothetical protein